MRDQSSMGSDELLRIMEGLAESLLEESDEEVLEEARLSGRDPETIAEGVRGVIKRALEGHGRRIREQAALEYREQVEALSTRQYELPLSRNGRLDLLAAAMRATPDLGGLTVAYRDFKKLPDEDLRTLLEKLAELGLLPDSGTGSGSD